MLSVNLADLVTDAFAFAFFFSFSIVHLLVCLVIGARMSSWLEVPGHNIGMVRAVEETHVALGVKRGIQLGPFGWHGPAMFLLLV